MVRYYSNEGRYHRVVINLSPDRCELLRLAWHVQDRRRAPKVVGPRSYINFLGFRSSSRQHSYLNDGANQSPRVDDVEFAQRRCGDASGRRGDGDYYCGRVQLVRRARAMEASTARTSINTSVVSAILLRSTAWRSKPAVATVITASARPAPRGHTSREALRASSTIHRIALISIFQAQTKLFLARRCLPEREMVARIDSAVRDG